MEGFNLFQEKIKGEVKASAFPDSSILFLQQDVFLSSDLLDFAQSRCDAVNYQSLNHNLSTEFFEADLEAGINDACIDLRIEYSDLQQMPTLEDLRYTFFNYNNDLPSAQKKKVVMFFD